MFQMRGDLSICCIFEDNFSTYHKLYLQLMEINKPDKGVFKGIGALETQQHHNRKYFPKIRNIHQFQYTHSHPNNYVSSFEKFFTPHKPAPPSRTKKHGNQTTIQLGTDPKNYCQSLSKTDYRLYQNTVPRKQIKQKEEGIGFGDQKGEFVTTTMEKFSKWGEKEGVKVSFKNRNLTRFNPITGETKALGFGFEDFQMGRRNNYRANNHTVVPSGTPFDIISGRKLTYK